MAFINTDKLFTYPSTGYTSRNGTIPDAITYRRTAQGMINWLQMQKRCVFWKGANVYRDGSDVFAGSDSEITDQFAFHVHTGYGVTRLRFITLAIDSDTANTGQPQFQWVDSTGGGADLDTVYMTDKDTAASSLNTVRRYGQYLTVTENTDYYFHLRTRYMCKVIAVGVYEAIDLTANESSSIKIAKSLFSDHDPVLDEYIGDLHSMAENLWERNSACLFSWAEEKTTSGVMNTSTTTYINCFENTETAWSASSVGVKINTQYMGTRTNTAIPCRLAVRGKIDSGTGTLKVIDSGGDLGSVSVTASSYTWYTTSINLTDQSGGHKIDFHFKTTGGSTPTFDVNAIQLFYYV